MVFILEGAVIGIMSDDLFLIFGLTSLAIFILFTIFGCILHRRRRRHYEAAYVTTVYGTQQPPMYSTGNHNNTGGVAVAVIGTETIHHHHHGRSILKSIQLIKQSGNSKFIS